MRLRRRLAFVLTVAMLMGNVTPAFAAESSGTNTVSGNVQITTDDNGNTVITGISNEMVNNEESGSDESGESSFEESGNDESGESSFEESGSDESGEDSFEESGSDESGEDSFEESGSDESGEDGFEESGSDESGEDGFEESGSDESGEDGFEESGSDESGEDEMQDEETISKNETDAEEETVSDNDLSADVTGVNLLDEAGGSIEVRHKEITYEYDSLEEAVEGIEKDFENAAGEYWFFFREDVILTEDITISLYVQEVHFETEEYEEDEEYIGHYQKKLDLNGHTLTMSAKLNLHTGLRITSSSGDKGTLKFDNEYSIYNEILSIKEDCKLIGDSGEVIDRDPVLTNVDVDAEVLNVSLYETDDANESRQNMSKVSLNVGELSVESGNWSVDEVTTNRLSIKGSGNDELQKATLLANNITVEGDFIEVQGTLGSFDEDKRPNLTLKNNTKLQIAENADCYLKELKIENSEVENRGQLILSTMDMGDFALYNYGNIIADEIVNVGSFLNDYKASLICNTFVQNKGQWTELADDSGMLINNSGTLYNVTAGRAVLGKGSKAQISINQAFEVSEEDLKMEIAVTDSYASISLLEGNMTYFNPYAYTDDANEEVVLIMPEAGDTLFSTDIEEFPAESIAVLPYEKIDDQGKIIKDEGGNSEDNPYTSAYQYKEYGSENEITKNEIQVSGETITVFATAPDGSTESYLEGFTGWNAAINYLNDVGNDGISYVIELNLEEIDFDGEMNLPYRAARIEIRGTGENPVVLKNTGEEIVSYSDLEFDNVTFEGAPTIVVYGQMIEFVSVRNVSENKETEIGRIDYAGTVLLEDSNIIVNSGDLSVADQIKLIDSSLTVKGDIETGTLWLQNIKSQAFLNAEGGISIEDIIIYGRGSGLSYETLVINGNIKSFTVDGQSEYSNVYAVPETQTAVIGDGIEATVDYYVISEEKPDDADYVEVKKNAISLVCNQSDAVVTGTKLATAPNIAASWFVYHRTIEESEGKEVEKIENVTCKDKEGYITYGAKDENDLNAVLYALIEAETYGKVEAYESLQEAFDEIERINDSQQSYKIVLKENDDITDYFPSIAEHISIQGAGDNKITITLPGNTDIKCDVDFENIILYSGSDNSVLNINGFEVGLSDSNIRGILTIKGSGIGTGSSLIVTGEVDEEIIIKNLDNVDMVSVIGSNLIVLEKTTVGKLRLEQGAVLCGHGEIKLTDVECYGFNTIVTVPTINQTGEENGSPVITEMTSNFTISGILNVYDNEDQDGILNIELGKVIEENAVECYTIEDFSDIMMSSDKAVIVKAAQVDTGKVWFNNNPENFLYKHNGNIVCKESSPKVELSYSYTDEDGNFVPAITYCESFADAVAEINSLKTKRDYTIRFRIGEISGAEELKMPNKAYVNTLTITSAGEEEQEGYICNIYYTKDITLTSDVILKDVCLVRTDSRKTDSGGVDYYSVTDKAVKIKTAGNDLTMAGNVTFNTPIALDGGSKGSLTIAAGANVMAGSQSVSVTDGAVSYIQGTVSNFAEVYVDQSLHLDGWTTSDGKYIPAELNVTGLKMISEGESVGDITVGHDGSSGDKVKVNDLTLNGADLYVYGTGEFKNVILTGNAPELRVYGQKFTITGVLTSTAKVKNEDGNSEGAKLVTTVNSKLQPVLDISGTAVLGDAVNNRVTVTVTDAEGNPITLGGDAGDGKTYSNYLLKAKKVSETAFLADTDCTQGKVNEFNTEEPEVGGYFLKKSQDYVEVAYSSDKGVLLYKNADYNNYYENLDAALKAIKSYNDKTAEYRILLLGDNGSKEAPYQLALPDKAGRVVFSAINKDITLYNGTKQNSQKTNVMFENITVVNTGTWDSKKSVLEINGADVTVNGKTTIGNLVLSNEAVLKTQGVTTITDILHEYLDSEKAASKLVCSPGNLTIKGSVTNINADENQTAKVVLDVNAAEITTGSNENQYVLSERIVVLEKETMDKFSFYRASEDVTDKAVWTSNGIYLVSDGYANAVKVQGFPEAEGDIVNSYTIKCLDFAEAVNYINNRSDKSSTYFIILEDNITDTKATDTDKVSALTLPGKDKAKEVIVSNNSESAEITFTGDLKVSGAVIFDRIILDNESFHITCEKNSDVKNGKEVLAGVSYLGLVNVKAAGLQGITGAKGATQIVLSNTKLITQAESNVQTLMLLGESSWEAWGTTTIGDVYLSELAATGTEETAVYIGTYHSNSGIPQLTVTGQVNGGNLPVKVYDFTTGQELTEYTDAKLVLAKAESAEKFIAYPFAEYNEEANGYLMSSLDGIAAWKDKDGYVYNGKIEDKEVILAEAESIDDVEEPIWKETYMATYQEAVEHINSQGNKDKVYKITLRKGNDANNENSVKLGSMLLPKESKAQSLTIDGNGMTLTYTGAIKATSTLEFTNIVLREEKNNAPVEGITLNTDKYDVIFGENVSTAYDSKETYNLEFSSIKGNKGGVAFGNNNAYSYGEVNLGRVLVTGDASLYAENKVTISDIHYRMDGAHLSVSGEKTMTINRVITDSEGMQDCALDITTWYTKANTLNNSKSQLTVNGEVSTNVAVNINPFVVDGAEYRMLDEELIGRFIIASGEKPQTFQKIITAPKMASENVTLINNKDLHAVRYDGGIYFASESTIEVIGYEEVPVNEEDGMVESKVVFSAGYLDWDMAVKEIDKLKRTDWSYEITLTNHLGGDGKPLKSLSLPSKAKEIVVSGTGDTGILTSSNKISIKCPTEFRNISLCNNSGSLTLDGGKFHMILRDLQRECEIDKIMYTSEIKLTGKDTIEIIAENNDDWELISKISNAGTVILNGDFEEALEHVQYEIEEGIEKVNLLKVMPGVEVISSGEVSVKDFYIGESTGIEEEDEAGNVSQKRNELDSRLQAKNITSTGTAVMASAELKAGTSSGGDSKITLNNVIFKDTYNHIEGKQDVDGNSLITIKGNTSSEDLNPGWAAATISLCLSNSVKRYAQLKDGLTLMTAPKAVTSLFRPHYNVDGESNMGPEIFETFSWMDEETQEVYEEKIPTFGLYKSGNDIKYGRLREISNDEVIELKEVRLWIGSADPDEVDRNIPYVEYASFEEAVAAINSMSLYKEGTKVFEEYTIEVLKDVEIGNEKGDGKYKALTLPNKVSELNILGSGHQIKISGNITLKSNTILSDVYFVPMKTVKGAVQPTAVNVAAGNYTLTILRADFGFWTGEARESEWNNTLNNITGSAKGRLIICENSYLRANNISGVAVEFAGNGEKLPDITNTDGLDEREARMGELVVSGKLTTKELKFTDCAVVSLSLYGNLTTDAVYVVGANNLLIRKYPGSSIQIKGTTRTLEDGSKVTGSVFFDEVEKYSEETEEPEMEGTDQIVLAIYSENEREVPSGEKVITGKYLNPDDWNIETVWSDQSGDSQFNKRSLYLNGTDLYLGGLKPEE